MDLSKESLKLHKELSGKIEVAVKREILTKEDLSLVYTPGVSAPCLEIAKDNNRVYDYTWKGNSVAVITDGSAVLGMGNIGPEASLPVMEGKAALFKSFANIDAIPIALDTQDTEEIIQTIKHLAPSFGGINLEDISAPRCIEIESRLDKELNIPAFHDDQHGTAIVLLAALINALKLAGKDKDSIRIVISGTGAAGSAIIKLLNAYGMTNIQAFNQHGMVHELAECEDSLQLELLNYLNTEIHYKSLSEALVGCDVFIGVSVADIVSVDMVTSMAQKAIVFAMANPNPEISYDLAKEAGALIVGTGRSDRPNQINNVLVFPGLFKGLLMSRSKSVPVELRIASAEIIASLTQRQDLRHDSIITDVFDSRIVPKLSKGIFDLVERLRSQGYDL